MNSKILLLLAFISASHVSQVFSAEGKLSFFQGEAKFAIEGIYGKGRQPNVVVAMDGTVLATFVSGEALQVRRSEDGGKTWGAPIILGKYKHIFSGGEDGSIRKARRCRAHGACLLTPSARRRSTPS